MSSSVTLNGTSYKIPTAGDTDWSDLSKWMIAANGAIGQASSGSLVTPVYNVKTYGAKGDGSTDDSVAIAAAMAALALTGTKGGTLYFPAGTYKFTGKLQFGVAVAQKNVIISGDGVGSVLKPTGSFSTDPVLEFRNCDYWRIEYVKVDASARTGTGDNVLVDGCSFGLASTCTISSATRYGVNITQINGSTPSAYNAVDGNTYTSNASGNVSVKEGTTGNIVNQASGVRPAGPLTNVKDFGAKGDGATDDTSAIKAAIAALWRGSGNLQGGALFFPRGDYLVSDTLDLSGHWGFSIRGEGPLASRILSSGMAGKDLINVSGSQHWGVEDIAIWGNAASVPRSAIRSQVAGGAFAPFDIFFRNVTIFGDADGAFTYGIWFSGGGSNNSEVMYSNVTISRCVEECLRKEGGETKDHNLYNCNFSVAKCGVHCVDLNDGTSATGFNWYGGGCAFLSEALVKLDNVGDPTSLFGLRVENTERLFDMGVGLGSLGTGVSIRDCSFGLSTGTSSSLSSWIQVSGLGPFIIEGNTFFAEDGPVRIKVSCGDVARGSIQNNLFLSANAHTVSPLVLNSPFASGLVVDNNSYSGASVGSPAHRLEPLDSTTTANVGVLGGSGSRGKGAYIVRTDLTKWIAAATSQSLPVFTIPKRSKIKGVYIYWNSRAALPGTPTITAKLGQASSGNEYILATDVSASDAQFAGGASGSLGTNLTTNYVQGGYVPDYFNDTTMYLTLTSGSGNVGTGTVTRFTGGDIFIIAEIDVLPGWLI